MTSGQLARRAKIIEEVIGLIAEVGADAVQMRDVAQRSEVALATLYRYFSSKENLLAAALADWQKRLTRRILAGGGPTGSDLGLGSVTVEVGGHRATSTQIRSSSSVQ